MFVGASQHELLLLFRRLGCSFRDNQEVVDAEHAGYGLGLQACDGLITLAIDNAKQHDVAIFHNNMDGVEAYGRIVENTASHPGDTRLRPGGLPHAALVGVVFPQDGLGINSVVNLYADVVVDHGCGQNFDVVFDRLDSVNPLNGIAGAGFQRRQPCVSVQDNGLIVQVEGDPIEDAVVGEAAQLRLYFLDNALSFLR